MSFYQNARNEANIEIFIAAQNVIRWSTDDDIIDVNQKPSNAVKITQTTETNWLNWRFGIFQRDRFTD